MKIILRFLFSLLLTSAFLHDQSQAALSDTPWKEIDNKDGIQTFKREIPGSPILAFKGIGTIPFPIARVASVLIDDKRAKEWVDAVEETRIVREISKFEVIAYTHVRTPIIMRDRDFVSHVKLDINKDKKSVILSYEPATDPLVPPSKFIRGEMMESSFVLVSKNGDTETEVTAEIHADPKGAVPKWVINLFQKFWPRQTLESLRAQCAKPDIVDNPLVKEGLGAKTGS